MSRRRVVAVVPDLFWSTRIAEAAARRGVDFVQAAPAEAVAVVGEAPTDAVILDLAGAALPQDPEKADDPLELARALKADPRTAHVRLIGFYPHVDGALRAAALAAGVDLVLPRSAFAARLGALLEAGLSPDAADC